MYKMAVKAESKKHADLLNLHQRATTRRLIKPDIVIFLRCYRKVSLRSTDLTKNSAISLLSRVPRAIS